MTSETRTVIELKDITGVEFECPGCQAKILYPFSKQYGRFATNCPSCNASWLLPNGPNTHPAAHTIMQELVTTFAALQKLLSDSRVDAKIRLQVSGLPEPK
jgi:hypothetical protein